MSSPAPLPLAAASARLRGKPGRPRKAQPDNNLYEEQARTAVRRLLDVAGAATYLSVSPWTIRDLVSVGTLPRVRVPIGPDRECRRLLIDRADLDRLIASWKQPT